MHPFPKSLKVAGYDVIAQYWNKGARIMPRTKRGFAFCRSLFRGNSPVIPSGRTPQEGLFAYIGGGSKSTFYAVSDISSRSKWPAFGKFIVKLARSEGVRIMWTTDIYKGWRG